MEKIYLRDVDDSQMEVDFVRFFHFKNTNYLIYTKNETDEKGYIKLYPVKVMESLGEKIARSIKDEIEWDNMQSIVKTVIKEIRDEKIESFIDLNKNEIENLKIVDSRFFKLDPKLVEILCSNSMLGIDKKVELSDIKNDIDSWIPPFEIDQNATNEINENETKVHIANDENVNEEITNSIVDNNISLSNNIIEKDKSDMENINVWQDKEIDNEEEVLKNDDDYKVMYEKVLKEKEELSDILTNMVIELTNYKIKYGELKED